jgi:hypothetical protein
MIGDETHEDTGRPKQRQRKSLRTIRKSEASNGRHDKKSRSQHSQNGGQKARSQPNQKSNEHDCGTTDYEGRKLQAKIPDQGESQQK